jgi:acyl-coenzyme A synthetase/AMP-(fatty) acid ligase
VRALASDDTCRVVFSSGTTGAPKGVAFSLDYLVKRVNSAERNWMPETPFMSLLGLDTVTGFQTLLWAIMRGETYFISSPHAPLNFDTLKKFDVAALKTSPARLNELLDLVEAKGQSLPHLNVVEVAGSLMSARTVNRAIHLLDRVPVYLYGSTEVGTVSRGAARREQPGFVGFIVGDVIAEVVDAAGTPVHPGVSGALRFQKDGIVSGYWNNPTPNGPSVGPQSVEDTRVSLKGFYDGWFYPGDNGVITEQGELLFEGRHDDLVNVEGSKFTLQQLDQWLQNVTVFDDAASFHFPHEDGSPRVGVIFVSPTEISKTVVERVISEFLVGIPVTVIARVDIIPRNSLGKVDKSAIFSKLGLS